MDNFINTVKTIQLEYLSYLNLYSQQKGIYSNLSRNTLQAVTGIINMLKDYHLNLVKNAN